MNFSKNKMTSTLADGPGRKIKIDLANRNYQLMRKREIDAMLEFARNEIIDKYYDLENYFEG